MTAAENPVAFLLQQQHTTSLRVHTLGGFRLWRNDALISQKEWGRDVSLQLFQFLLTHRHRRGMHKEQIIDRIWTDIDVKAGLQNFKVAHHGCNKVLEPDRQRRSEPTYIVRQGLSYYLKTEDIWIDAQVLDELIILANQSLLDDPDLARKAYYAAIDLYQGTYLPNRLYEDWSSAERERLQLLVLGAIINLSELVLPKNPLESVRLTQQALQIDHTWEDAYRIQIQAYLTKGNRPMAIKTYRRCCEVLDEEFGIEPLPETKQFFEKIKL